MHAMLPDVRDTTEQTWIERDIENGMFWSAQALLAPEAELPDSRDTVESTLMSHLLRSDCFGARKLCLRQKQSFWISETQWNQP